MVSRLHEIKRILLKLMPSLDSRKRGCINAYLVAIDGMILLQKIGKAIARITRQEPRGVNRAYWDLAAELEEWFYYYKKEWRLVSKESELYQIQDLILWYADFLRS